MCRKSIYLTALVVLGWAGTLTGGELIKVNFQLAGAPIPEGYLPDTGLIFDDRGNGYSYGWSQDMTDQTRDRNNAAAPDQRYDTLIHFRGRGAVWEIELAPGTYRIFIVCGDPSNADSNNQIELEGEILADDPDGLDSFDEFEFIIPVTDGRLTWSEPAGAYVKPCFIEIESSKPIVKATKPDPKDGAMHFDTWVNLSWTPSELAVSHDVYLGEGFDDVNDATTESETFRGNQTATFFVAGFPGFAYPDGLVPGTTYYWRIDEVNDADPNSPWKGDVWSFSIPPKTAYDPDPPDGAKFVDADVILSWTAGFGAKLHTVYFGDNFDTVNDASGGISQAATTYNPGPLALEATFYWRVDEFDGAATHTGNVWSFSTLPDIQITDPTLAAWWKFDEGTGHTAHDWSGHNHHGSLMGDPQWVIGYDGDALDFDGNDDYVHSSDVSIPTGAFTIAFWFNPETDLNASNPRQDFIYWESIARPHITFNRSGNGEIGMWPNIGGDFDGPETTTTSWAAGTWYHIAGTFDGTNFKIHVNGNTERSVSHPGEHASNTGLFIGCRSNLANNFNGMIDDVRIYDYALSDAEIKEAMRGDPFLAWNPKPAHNSTPNVKDAASLSWQPGNKAAQHDVYFGMDRDVLESADESDTTGIYRGRQTATSYTPPEGVEWGGGPYYWRIDEYNADGTISKGRIWSFTVADYLLVDDFESYTDNDAAGEAVWQHWIDGYGVADNGSQAGNLMPPYCEQTIVHGGVQSMPLLYTNEMGVTNSEVALTLTTTRDWTEEGVAELSLWVHGDSANAAEPLYVAVSNPQGTPAIVANDDSLVAQIGSWTQWVIPLQAIEDQGITLTNVDKIAIGLGSKSGMVSAGGSGTMFIDDIALYR